ncbi:permease [Synoicihabitans lomoniglobus]|uniref:Permease n=1 Tax=Synoicihabitans lomoniglobus TaxID=2909285 RepID=A0AAE9ZY98_9BACT|nr:permease [Opitutaceae bacterium LMO-M01]WED64793.1 permease [Opitutaceae bacterium LMO-M01]
MLSPIIAFSLFRPFEWAAQEFVQLIGLSPDSPWGAALAFFFYEIAKVSILIFAISWVMALVRRALPIEAMRRWLQTPIGRILGYPGAAAFGALTPFCSCSSVPLFIGFIEARLPIGIALAFLITSPLVNEIIVALFIASFGWKVAVIYMAAGMTLGVVGGWILQRLRAERWLTDFAQRKTARVSAPAAPIVVTAAASSGGCCGTGQSPPEPDTPGCDCETSTSCGDAQPPVESAIAFANHEARDIYVGVLPYLAIALLLGAGIHGFVPEHALAAWFATGRWWDVPAAVVFGFPLYASANAIVPVLETLVAKGVPLGTGMAFIMAAVGVSVPELIILKRVMTVRLMIAFSLTVSVGVVLVGFLFNFLS